MEFENDYNQTDSESDDFLLDVPMSLIKENIKIQFDEPLDHSRKDHINQFISTYRSSKEHIDDYDSDDDDQDIIELRDDFYAFMINMFRDYINLGIVDFDDMSEDDQDDMIHYIYRFFIINIKKNFVCFILNKIEDNRDTYVETDDKYNDVTSLSFKKNITDPYDMHVLSDLGNIVDDILNEEIYPDEFLEKCDNDASLETRFMKSKFNKDKITGNFVPKYIDMIDADFISEIEAKIRNKILKKYKKIHEGEE